MLFSKSSSFSLVPFLTAIIIGTLQLNAQEVDAKLMAEAFEKLHKGLQTDPKDWQVDLQIAEHVDGHQYSKIVVTLTNVSGAPRRVWYGDSVLGQYNVEFTRNGEKFLTSPQAFRRAGSLRSRTTTVEPGEGRKLTVPVSNFFDDRQIPPGLYTIRVTWPLREEVADDNAREKYKAALEASVSFTVR